MEPYVSSEVAVKIRSSHQISQRSLAALLANNPLVSGKLVHLHDRHGMTGTGSLGCCTEIHIHCTSGSFGEVGRNPEYGIIAKGCC